MFPSWNPHNTSRIFPWSSSKWRVAMMLASKVLVFALSGDTSNSIWVYWVYHTDLGKLSPTWNKAHNGPPSFQRGYSEVVICYPDLGILDYWVYHSVSYRYVWKHLERSKKMKELKVISIYDGSTFRVCRTILYGIYDWTSENGISLVTIYGCKTTLICNTVTDRIMEKKNVSIYRRRLSMIEKLRTFFFHNYCFHTYFFSIILSVTVCPSIRNLNAF